MRWQILIFLLTLRETLGHFWWSEFSYSGPKFCTLLQRDSSQNSSLRDPYEEQNAAVVLLWVNPLERAAAALLRATMLAAGYNANLIMVWRYEYFKNRDTIDTRPIKVEVPKSFELKVRFSPEAAKHIYCTTEFAINMKIQLYRHCDFIVAETTNTEEKTAIIYITNELKHTCTDQYIRKLAAVAISAQFEFSYVERSKLMHLIRHSNRSFMYIDSHNQTNESPELFPTNYNDTHCNATLVKPVVLKYSGDLLPETSIQFSPTLNDLHSLLNIQKDTHYMTMESAACNWALQGSKQFKKWRKTAVINADQKRVVVAVCKDEPQDFKEYLYMIDVLAENKNNSVSTLIDTNRTLFQVFFLSCNETDPLFSNLFNWAKNELIHNVLGLVLTDSIATKAVPWAEKFGLELFTYDVSIGASNVYAVGGNVKHLELGLRRLLADCGWQRLAVISEPTQLAEALSAALRAPAAQLTVREVIMKSTTKSYCLEVLKKLLTAKARVILINARTVIASTVLKIARQLHMTPDKGYVWIVREYDAVDDATAEMMPYSVSFSWRGDGDYIGKREKENTVMDHSKTAGKGMTDNMSLLKRLDEKWRGRAWPPHAAPMLDALLIIIERIRLNDKSNGNLSLWSDMQEGHTITGIKQNLTIDEKGIAATLVYVKQWSSGPGPRLLATWRGGEWRRPAEACPAPDPPTDGTTTCLTPYGDPFQPTCRDIIWIFSAIVSAIFGTSLVFAAVRWTRLSLSIRDQRVETQFAKRMLARKERVFEALADHLVDRSALELLQELGTGRFGRVHHGLLRESGRQIVVAAKSLREEASSAEESEFLKEACTLAALDHKNIIRFVGVCVVDGPPLLLMEHAFFGDLLHYLQARRYLVGGTNAETSPSWFEADEKAHVTARALTQLAQEAAEALAYLADRGIVHRDVRASNCLVDERRRLKLADFGLARATGTADGEYQMCRRGVLPVLWMAPESLATGVSSAASDVWSLGVLVFELVTLGRRPYGVQPPPVVLRHVLAGGQPRLPWDASAETRALTRACWRREPEARPAAARLARWLTTRWHALRPALVAELVDIDTLNNDDQFNEPDLCSPDTPLSEALPNQP